jgi:hypothetical protein
VSRPLALTLVTAALAVSLALAAVWLVLRPGGPPLTAAAFDAAAISPNGDGRDDTLRITYSLRRPAAVSIIFIDEAGQTFTFRAERARDAGDYTVDFSGVVDAFTLPGESLPAGFAGQVLRRVLPDGRYRWVVAATDAQGRANEIRGQLTITDADTALPLVVNLGVSPPTFTPNQDGIGDRVDINVPLEKDVPEGGLRVFLIGPDGTRLPIAATPSGLRPGQRGVHTYNYDAGIDQGLEPPTDGAYTVRVEVQDAVGQQVAVETQLLIANGGLPRAQIFRGDVEFSATSVISGSVLYFQLVVENYGSAPLRTTGPASGFIYESMSLNANSLGAYEESGAWRVGINCQTCKSDFPWRWALGAAETLTLIPDADGNPHYYLMPGQMAVVTGGIVLDEVIPSRNPQYFWAGLIHEDVRVVNNRIDQALVEIIAP